MHKSPKSNNVAKQHNFSKVNLESGNVKPMTINDIRFVKAYLVGVGDSRWIRPNDCNTDMAVLVSLNR